MVMVIGFTSDRKHRFLFFFPCVKEETVGQIPGIIGERAEQQNVSEGDIPRVPLK